MPSTLTCSYCNIVFTAASFKEVSSLRNVHTRSCKPEVVVNYSGEKVTVTRDPETKKFICYCDAPGCPQSYDTTQGIQRHAKNHKWIGKVNNFVSFNIIALS